MHTKPTYIVLLKVYESPTAHHTSPLSAKCQVHSLSPSNFYSLDIHVFHISMLLL